VAEWLEQRVTGISHLVDAGSNPVLTTQQTAEMAKMTKEKAGKVYDLLVSIGGAYEPDRDNFIYHHTESKEGCSEWRFSGKLGFGGKYRSGYNGVDCYREDETPERIKLMNELNGALAKI
jgi:hypothetical protein